MLDDVFDIHTDEGRERFRQLCLSVIRAGGCFVLALVMGYLQPHALHMVFLPAMVIGACAMLRMTMPVAIVGLSLFLALLVLPAGVFVR